MTTLNTRATDNPSRRSRRNSAAASATRSATMAVPDCADREVPMRVLVVDDELRLASSLSVGLEAEGFAVDVAHDGTDGLWLARENTYDAIVLDLMLPGHQRLQGLRDAARREELDADPDAHRQGRRVGPGRGSGHRRGRLPDQAVLVPGARGPAAGRGRRGARERPDDARGRRPAARPGGAAGLARGGRDRADRAGVLAAGVPRPPPGRRRVQAPDPRGGVGRRLRGRPEHRRGLRPPPAQQDRPAVRREAIQTLRGAGYRLGSDGG